MSAPHAEQVSDFCASAVFGVGLPNDVDERESWPAYQAAYQVAIDKCSTQDALWFVVPADRKWYARLAVQQLVVEHLREMALEWPTATFDVEAEKLRLAAT